MELELADPMIKKLDTMEERLDKLAQLVKPKKSVKKIIPVWPLLQMFSGHTRPKEGQ